jgi:hypothetical protein
MFDGGGFYNRSIRTQSLGYMLLLCGFMCTQKWRSGAAFGSGGGGGLMAKRNARIFGSLRIPRLSERASREGVDTKKLLRSRRLCHEADIEFRFQAISIYI